MTRRGFEIYEIAGPLLVTPAAVAAWYAYAGGRWSIVALAMLVPILYAYVVPGIGTNVLKVWRLNSRFAVGGFRWQHGFLFGGATALITVAVFALTGGFAGSAAISVLAAIVLLAVNWWYDVVALKHRILEVFNQPWAEGRGPWAVTADYVIWFFGVFGFVYAFAVRTALSQPSLSWWQALASFAAALILPVVCYILASYLRHGHSGCFPRLRPETAT